MAGSPQITRVRVLIAAAARLYREGLARELTDRPSFEVIGLASTAHAAMARLRALAPDVSLVDLGMPGSLPLVRAMRADRPEVQVVTLSVPEAELEVLACADAGAAGFVTLDSSLDDLCAILRSVGRGEALYPPWIAGALLRHVAALASGGGGTLGMDLTARERDVMELVDRGLSNKEIGRLLHIELPTVKNHVHNILRKLQVSRRSDAITRFRGAMVGVHGDEMTRAEAFGLGAQAPLPRAPGS
jgi:two-component system, NarL family, nitrate/nitrite response regulator NarL